MLEISLNKNFQIGITRTPFYSKEQKELVILSTLFYG